MMQYLDHTVDTRSMQLRVFERKSWGKKSSFKQQNHEIFHCFVIFVGFNTITQGSESAQSVQ